MTREEMRIEREELCHIFGFDNRWTAMIFQWCRDEFGFVPDDVEISTVADDCREFVLSKGVPEYRLGGVDFTDVAIALVEYA
jgi:hypothetical protein